MVNVTTTERMTFREQVVASVAARLRVATPGELYRIAETALGQDHGVCQAIRQRLGLKAEDNMAHYYSDLKQRAGVLD